MKSQVSHLILVAHPHHPMSVIKRHSTLSCICFMFKKTTVAVRPSMTQATVAHHFASYRLHPGMLSPRASFGYIVPLLPNCMGLCFKGKKKQHVRFENNCGVEGLEMSSCTTTPWSRRGGRGRRRCKGRKGRKGRRERRGRRGRRGRGHVAAPTQ